MGFYNTEALILKARDWGEADRLVTLFSRDKGKLVAVAKGLRKPQSKLRGGVQVLSRSELMLHTGRSLDRITGSQSIHGFDLGDSLDKLTCGMYWADLLDRILPEREANPPIYELAMKSLAGLEASDSGRFPLEAFSLFFEWNLINLMGYQPCLDCCVLCREPLEPEREREFNFSAGEGGLLCRSCSPGTDGRVRLTAPTLAILRRWSAISFNHFNRIAVSPASRQEINTVVESVLLYHLERDLPSRGFLNRLGG
ncbi:MAG: DNA repair protein RecO [Firmicutes bacterium]|nr:DNA repair protein RecO [Bacillota bacterium]